MTATYVYCLVASARRPSLRGVPRGLPGTCGVRLIDAGAAPARLRKWLVVTDAPPNRYSESIINSRLQDLEWVSRAAVAHEAVVEAFIDAAAIVPMKLFTIFATDDRALEHVASQASRVDAMIRRVARHREWGVRIVLDRTAPRPSQTKRT